MNDERQIWLNGLKIGDQVLLVRARKAPTVMIVRTVDDRHICMVDARNPRADLAHGEVVWLERGEGPYGEAIYPIDPGVLPAIGDRTFPDSAVGGWEAA